MNSNGNDRPVSDGGFANTPSKAPFRALNLPLAGLRIVTTRPPLDWFGGVDFDFATEMAEELRAMGAAVFELDVRGFIFPNRDYVKAVTQELRSFHPDVAMALPNATVRPPLLQRPRSKYLPRHPADPRHYALGPRPAPVAEVVPQPLAGHTVPVHYRIDPEASRGFESSPVPSLLAR